jgi:histidinol-phosphate aminotransferase
MLCQSSQWVLQMPILPQPKHWLATLPPYVGGESTIRPSAVRPVRLTSNEGALGPSSLAVQAFREAVFNLSLYPQANCLKLRQAIADVHDLDPQWIICGNGSDELISLITRAYVGVGDEVLYSAHGFLMYKLAALAEGAVPIPVAEQGYRGDVEALLKSVTPRTKLIFLANPNNPTGTYLTRHEIARLLEALPGHILLVLDGAYAEFAEAPDFDDFLKTPHDNLVVLRTFSKAYALAGVRLGWGVFPFQVAEIINRLRSPFNVNGAAQAAGIAAVQDKSHLQATVAHNCQWRAILTKKLKELGYPVLPSQANFVLFETGQATRMVYEYLAARNVFVRPVDSYGLPGHLRVTVGSAPDCQAFLDVLAGFSHV